MFVTSITLGTKMKNLAVTAEISKIFHRANNDQPFFAAKKSKEKDNMKNPEFAAFVEQKQLVAERNGSLGGGANAESAISSPTSLSTTARRGTARLESALERTKSTKLWKEKDKVTKSNRLLRTAIGTAYQITQDISGQVESNKPGYKTERLRSSTVDVSLRIAGATSKLAVGLFGGAKAYLLGRSNRKQQQQPQLPLSSSPKVNAKPVEFVDDRA